MNKRKFLIPDLVNSILGALVGITGNIPTEQLTFS